MWRYIVVFLSGWFFCACTGSFSNKRILICAPEGYAQRFSESIRKVSGIPVVIPMIETVIPVENPSLDSLLLHLDGYDWVAFPSRKAIQAFFQCARRLQIESETIRRTSFCVIGKDADMLRNEYGIQPTLVPKEPSPAGIVAALCDKQGTDGQSIAVLAPQVVRITEPDVVPNFVRSLKEINMKVNRVNAYITRPADIPEREQLIRNISNGWFDVIAFSSTAEIESFVEMMDHHCLPPKQVIACFGPYTAGNARRLNLDVTIVAKDFSSFDGFAESIREYFEKQ